MSAVDTQDTRKSTINIQHDPMFFQHIVDWEIKDFIHMFKSMERPILSPQVTLLGSEFQLKINRIKQGGSDVYQDWIGIYLIRQTTGLRNSCVEYTLGIKNNKNNIFKSVDYRYTSIGNEDPPAFVEKADFLQEQEIFKPGDVLTVFCKIRVDIHTEGTTDLHYLSYSSKAGEDLLIKSLEDLYLKKVLCDIKFSVEGEVFEAHRAILEGRSPVFASMFNSTMDNENIDITDCDAVTFNNFLHYFYSGRVENVSSNNTISLYYMAHKYKVPQLMADCLLQLSNITKKNFFDIVHFAMTIPVPDLKYNVQTCWRENQQDASFIEEFLQFMKKHWLCCGHYFEEPSLPHS